MDRKPLQEIVETLRKCRTQKECVAVLKSLEDDARWLALCVYAYHPFITYPIGPEDLLKEPKVEGLPMSGPKELFDSLKTRAVTGPLAIATCRRFMAERPTLAPLVPLVLGKDLMCGVSHGMLQSVYGGEFDTSSVASPANALPDFTAGKWLAARRPPGVFVAVLKHHFTSFMARDGRKQYITPKVIENEMLKVPDYACWIGHVCAVVDGRETDAGVLDALDGKGGMDNLKLVVHDKLTPPGYCHGRQESVRSERIKEAAALLEAFKLPPEVVSLAKHAQVPDAARFEALKGKAKGMGWGMLALRRDAVYDRHDADIEVPL